MRRNPTSLESRLWRHLSNTQLGHKFRRQHVISPYICDFFCPAKGLVIEVDGDTHDMMYDERRDACLSAHGFAVLRFTNHEVFDNPDGVVSTILAVLKQRPDRWSGGPHPNPSPEGGGLRSRTRKLLTFGGGVGVGHVTRDEPDENTQ